MMESVTETPCDREQHSWVLNQLIHHVTPRDLYSLVSDSLFVSCECLC